MLPVNADTMRDIVLTYKGTAGIQQTRIINGVGAVLQLRLPEYSIDTPLRIAHFLAQCAEESAGYRTLVEFSSGVQYNDRTDLGNAQPNDGPKFRGRGLLEITGRFNYAKIGKALGLDLETNPDLLNDPETALRASCEFWKSHDLNTPADSDDIITITKKINGGTAGLDSRRAYLSKAKAAVAKVAAAAKTSVPAEPAHPVLHRGMDSPDVGRIQTILNAAGMHKLAIDNSFGAATELAISLVQADYHITDDGIVGPATWAVLEQIAEEGITHLP